MGKKLGERAITTLTAVIIAVIITVAIVGPLVYVLKPAPAPEVSEVTRADVESYLRGASEEEVKSIISETVSQDLISEVAKKPRKCVVAVNHFLPLAGCSWNVAWDRGMKRLADKYPWLEYIYEENVQTEAQIPTAEDFIKTKGANIVIANAEYTGLPLLDIADKYPDVYFSFIIASDLSVKRNVIRYFPRQYQAVYLAGLVAGALTKTKKVGMVAPMYNVQYCRRLAAFYLGLKETAPNATLYVKFVGSWHDPAAEAKVSETLIDEYGVDVLTQQTDSSAPVGVAEKRGIWFIGKDIDIVGEMGWSSEQTVAVSFDVRWEVGVERMVEEWAAGDKYPDNILFLGMNYKFKDREGKEYPIVDLQNNHRVGIDAISSYARPLIPDDVINLIKERREAMMEGIWDPFEYYELVSAGTGFDLPGLPVPPKGTVVKPAGEMPSDEWLFTKFNFDLEGIVVLG